MKMEVLKQTPDKVGGTIFMEVPASLHPSPGACHIGLDHLPMMQKAELNTCTVGC